MTNLAIATDSDRTRVKEHLPQELKARIANVFRTCPDWCDGTQHEERALHEHSVMVGEVLNYSVYLAQAIDDEGLPTGPVGVQVYSDITRVALLSGEDMEAFQRTFDKAMDLTCVYSPPAAV